MKIRSQLLFRVGGWLMFLFIQTWMATLRYRALIPDKSTDPATPDPDPERPRRRIYLFWHEYILFPLYLRGHCNVATIISQHNDAAMLFYAAQLMGYDIVRGSTRHGATKALRGMMELSENAKHLTLTPDGPRGPRRTLAPGAIFLASQLQRPLILMGMGYDRPWRVNSWDRFAMPRPFSKARVIFSEEIMIPPDLNKEQIEEYRQKVEEQLNELTEQAQQWALSGEKREGEVVTSRKTFGQARYE